MNTDKNMKTQYDKYKNNRIWKKIEKSLQDLENEKKLKISGSQEDVIGYIVKNIIEDEPVKADNKR